MDFFKQLFNSVSNQAADRVKSLYTGTFIFSWLAINWKVLAYILFSKKSMEVKLEGFDKYFSDTLWFQSWLTSDVFIQNTLLKPLLISLIIVIAIPALNTFADFIKILSNLANNKLQRNFAGWMSPERSQSLLDEINILKSGQGNLFVEKNEEIDKLQGKISNLESQISADKTRHIDEIEKVKNSLKSSVDSAEKKRDEFHEKLNESKEKVLGLEQQINSHQQQQQQMSTQNSELNQQLTKQVQETAPYKNLQNQLTNQQNSNKGLQEKLKVANDEFSKQIVKLQQAIAQGSSSRESQQQKLIEQFSAQLDLATQTIEKYAASQGTDSKD